MSKPMFRINSLGMLPARPEYVGDAPLGEFINLILRQTPFRAPVTPELQATLLAQLAKEREGAESLALDIPHDEETILSFIEEKVSLLEPAEVSRHSTDYLVAENETTRIYLRNLESPEGSIAGNFESGYVDIAITLHGVYYRTDQALHSGFQYLPGDVDIIDAHYSLLNIHTDRTGRKAPTWVLFIRQKL